MIDFYNTIEKFEHQYKIRLFLELKSACEEDEELYNMIKEFIFNKENIKSQ